jgi:hypothetical protein
MEKEDAVGSNGLLKDGVGKLNFHMLENET